MSPEPGRLEALYKAALDLGPNERTAFLREACGADEALRLAIETRLRQAQGDLEETRSAYDTLPRQSRNWGSLHLMTEIGAGGFGRVYRARDPTLARDVALKVIALRSPDDAAAVLHEGQMLARVRHRNVVTIHAAQRIGEEVGVTMELVEGQNLADLVRANGPMGADEAAVIGVHLCQALAAVHAAGLVHRDVKARNVMRERGGRIVLMDFGLGLDVATAQGEGSTISGTPPYIAPELFDGRVATAGSDLYSLGVLLFFLVTGEYPVPEGSVAAVARAHARGERQYLGDLRPDLPAAFVRVVEEALARNPARRFPSAGAMMQALVDAMPGAATAGPRASGPARPVRGDDTHRQSQALAWLLGVSGAAAGVWALGLVMSVAFNATLQRTDGFADDTPLDWLEFGARSLVTPLIYAVLIMAALLAMRTLWHAVRHGARPIAERSTASIRRLSRIVGMAEPAAAAQWLIVAQGLALAAVFWSFSDVFAMLAYFPEVSPSSVALLSESSLTPVYYRQALSATLVVTGLAWYALLSQPVAARSIDRQVKTGGLVLLIVTLFALELPYRLMFHSDRDVLDVQGLRCYELGRFQGEVLTYCPEWDSPRIRVIPDDGGTVVRTGLREHLFTPPLSR